MRTLRTALAATIFLLSPGLAGYAAAGQVISSQVTGVSAVGVPGSLPVMTGGSFSHSGVSLAPASLLAAPMAAPAPTVKDAGTGLALQTVLAAPVLTAETRVLLPLAASGQTVEPAKTQAVPTAMAALRQGAPAETSKTEAVEVSAQRMGGLMDGMTPKRADDSAPVAAGQALLSQAAPLAKAQAAAPDAKPSLPSPERSAARRALAVKLLVTAVVAGLVLLMPVAALAAGVPGVGALSFATAMGYMNPTASVVAAVVGSVYGAIAAKGKDGKGASTGEVFGSVLRYGILAGAGVYACMDIASLVFLGTRGIISPLPTALATAALGQGAFQGKFKEAETSSADRIMAVFPAVAAALGLSIVEKALPGASLLYTLGVKAMMLTGTASALFAAVYDPAKSPADGPDRMARGYVLQALMTGLALAVGNPYLTALFAALAVWGFADVAWASSRTIGKFVLDLYHKYFPPAPKKS
ncbi:MAG: hypothetical protein NTY77_09925 [Elusimicrobia bacterium]|nr:hypothetical protein [Elusimicrobiota bacterium]